MEMFRSQAKMKSREGRCSGEKEKAKKKETKKSKSKRTYSLIKNKVSHKGEILRIRFLKETKDAANMERS